MTPLTGTQKKYLRGLAHSLDPVVVIGRAGLSEGLVASAEKTLMDHELIKVRFSDHKDRKKELAQELASATGAEVAGLIGHMAVLYRPHPEEEKRKIRLPRRNG